MFNFAKIARHVRLWGRKRKTTPPAPAFEVSREEELDRIFADLPLKRHYPQWTATLPDGLDTQLTVYGRTKSEARAALKRMIQCDRTPGARRERLPVGMRLELCELDGR